MTRPAATSTATRYAALLRGVNVKGITIRSADPEALPVSLGFGSMRTLLASGNALFDSAERSAALKKKIAIALHERLFYDARIALVAPADLAQAVKAHPLEREDEIRNPKSEIRHPYVVCVADAALLKELFRDAGFTSSANERLAPRKSVLYWQCPRGASTGTPIAKLLGKARYQFSITPRNLRTIEKLIER